MTNQPLFSHALPRSVIDFVLLAATDVRDHPALASVFLRPDGDGLVVEATDTVRLHRATFPGLHLPGAINLRSSAFAGSGDPVVAVSGGSVSVSGSVIDLLVDAAPRLEQIVARGEHVVLGLAALADALRPVPKWSASRSDVVQLHASGSTLTVTSLAGKLGNLTARSPASVHTSGVVADVEARVNAHFLSEAVAALRNAAPAGAQLCLHLDPSRVALSTDDDGRTLTAIIASFSG